MLAAACALLAGCGREPSKPSSKPAKTTQAAREVMIDAPADGRRLRAKETKGGSWIARVKLRGGAAPGSTVLLRAACKPEPCRSRTRAGADGRWTVAMGVRTRPSVRFVTIDAGREERLADGSSVVTIELFGPRTVLARSGPSKPKSNRATQEPSRALPREVLVIGDSLGLGMAPALEAQLRGWRVRVDARPSRTLAQGMRILARRSKPPAIVAFSLLTNDSPRGVRQLAAAVRGSASADGCAVWATIARPPREATGYAAVNRRLKQLARQEQLALGLQVVDWAGAVARRPSLLARDGVHATATGYATRARLYAGAIRRCAGERR